MNRRTLLLSAIALPLMSRVALATPTRMTVYLSPTCGCCSAWVEHARTAGYDLTVIESDQEELMRQKSERGVPDALAGCHTVDVDGYTIEGHVPMEDIARLLSERPDALGLAVPGMPAGSPGMDMGGRVDPFDVMLFTVDGEPTVFASHS